MRTGEGKTLTATMPTYLNALAGQVFMLLQSMNTYLVFKVKKWLNYMSFRFNSWFKSK